MQRRHLVGMVVAAALLLFIGAAQAASPIERITVDELNVLRSGDVVVIDIRRADEWRTTGVIEGSRLITAFDAAGDLDPDFISAVSSAADHGQPVVLICRSGNRSAAAARLLAEHGDLARIYDVAGGMREWMGRGRPVAPCPSC